MASQLYVVEKENVLLVVSCGRAQTDEDSIGNDVILSTWIAFQIHLTSHHLTHHVPAFEISK
jgi:hypothetical protein